MGRAERMTEKHHSADELAELRTLLAAVVFDDASDEQLDRLNDLLKSDLELRRFASRFLEEESVLRRQFELLGRVVDFHQAPLSGQSGVGLPASSQQSLPSEGNRQTGRTRKSGAARRGAFAIFIAASIFLVLGAPALWTRDKAGVEFAAPNPESAQPLEVGLFVQGQFVDWEDESLRPTRKSLRIGDVIATDDGLMNLRFHCGAEVLLKGPAQLEVLSPMRALLRRGTLTARMEDSAHGFRIDTPNSKITDLGTEFGLSVDEEGATDTVVFSGKSRCNTPSFVLSKKQPMNRRRLQAACGN